MLKMSLVIAVLALHAGATLAQDFPSRPIRIVATGAGGAGDFAARAMAQGISTSLGQQVIVDNRPTNVIASEAVFKSPPDGYTLLRNGNNFWLGPLLQKTPYDPLADFVAITLTDQSPNILVMHPSVPAKSVKELIALAKARPGELNYGSGSTGGGGHLSGELFKSLANVNIVRVPYKSLAPALVELMGGQIQLAFPSPPAATPLVQSGKLKALAVTSAKPSSLFPNLPTVGAAVPGYELAGMTAIFAPTKTPDAIVRRLNQEMVRYLHTADAKDKFFNAGSDVMGTTPEETTSIIRADFNRMSKLIKEAGIKAD